MEEFLGRKYKLKTSENFEEYMKFIGIGYVSRKAALAVSPVASIIQNSDSSYTVSMCTPIRDVLLTFRLGEELEEIRADGVKVKTLITFDGNKIIHTQVEQNGRKSTHTRVFTKDKLIVTSTCEGWDGASIRTYELVE